MIYINVEHIRRLEINRLIRELDYVKSDYSYKSELMQEVDTEFINNVDSFLLHHPQLKQIFDESVSKRNVNMDIVEKSKEVKSDFEIPFVESESEQINIEETFTEVKDVKIKNLYRSIAKSTHPDRIKDENLKELYLEATNAYEGNDIIPILAICDKLRIPYEVTEEETNLIKNEIENIKHRSLFLESTYTFKWYMTQDLNERDKIILSYIKSQLIK
jgi:hypothetical protein